MCAIVCVARIYEHAQITAILFLFGSVPRCFVRPVNLLASSRGPPPLRPRWFQALSLPAAALCHVCRGTLTSRYTMAMDAPWQEITENNRFWQVHHGRGHTSTKPPYLWPKKSRNLGSRFSTENDPVFRF